MQNNFNKKWKGLDKLNKIKKMKKKEGFINKKFMIGMSKKKWTIKNLTETLMSQLIFIFHPLKKSKNRKKKK